jgi:hypothetical protein
MLFFIPIAYDYTHIDTFRTCRFGFLLTTRYFCNLMRNAPIPLILTIMLGTACQKGNSVDLRDKGAQLVVEGMIEDGKYPTVTLSRSLDYFSKISPEQLLASFVHGAKVTISNGINTHQLREYSSDTSNGTGTCFYTVDTANILSAFAGERGVSYTLRIEAEGKVITSITTIPEGRFSLDSIGWKRVEGPDASKVRLFVKVTDPPERGNYIRYFTSRNKEDFMAGLNSVFDDKVVNGTTFEIPLDAGVDKNNEINEGQFFKRGDTVALKFCNVDHGTYDFWRTLDYAYNDTGNPFSKPIRVISNVQGALGYWGGYCVTYKTITIPK